MLNVRLHSALNNIRLHRRRKTPRELPKQKLMMQQLRKKQKIELLLYQV